MNLETIRKDIEKIDQEIINLLAKRFNLAKQTRQFKKQAEDLSREKEVLDYLTKLAKEYKLSFEFIEKLYKLIFTESKKLQD